MPFPSAPNARKLSKITTLVYAKHYIQQLTTAVEKANHLLLEHSPDVAHQVPTIEQVAGAFQQNAMISKDIFAERTTVLTEELRRSMSCTPPVLKATRLAVS